MGIVLVLAFGVVRLFVCYPWSFYLVTKPMLIEYKPY